MNLTFSDVLIEPQYSEISSRTNIDLSVDFGQIKLTLPVVSANMRDITGSKMVCVMREMGGLGILPRFQNTNEAVEDFLHASQKLRDANQLSSYCCVAVSVGVQKEDKERFKNLYDAGARLFCVDVSHGHHILVRNMVEYMRLTTSNDIDIIAGNVATYQGVMDLYSWGANIIKVGIGPGEVCQTRKNTGVGVPQIHALKEARKAAWDIDGSLAWNSSKMAPIIIGDGGIKNTGDVAKALAYADVVMIGNLLAGSSETPGHVYENAEGKFYKVYGGSASGERKTDCGKKNDFVEGVIKTVDFKGHAKYILDRIGDGIRTAFSYTGARNMQEYHTKVILKHISAGGRSESKI